MHFNITSATHCCGVAILFILLIFFCKKHDPKFLDRQIQANSVEPDQ